MTALGYDQMKNALMHCGGGSPGSAGGFVGGVIEQEAGGLVGQAELFVDRAEQIREGVQIVVGHAIQRFDQAILSDARGFFQHSAAAGGKGDVEAAGICFGFGASDEATVDQFLHNNGDGRLMRAGAIGEVVDGKRAGFGELLKDEELSAGDAGFFSASLAEGARRKWTRRRISSMTARVRYGFEWESMHGCCSGGAA